MSSRLIAKCLQLRYQAGEVTVARSASCASCNALRIAVDSPDAPPALINEADLIVDGPEGLLEFLTRLLA
jgi:hypothetical protein